MLNEKYRIGCFCIPRGLCNYEMKFSQNTSNEFDGKDLPWARNKNQLLNQLELLIYGFLEIALQSKYYFRILLKLLSNRMPNPKILCIPK